MKKKTLSIVPTRKIVLGLIILLGITSACKKEESEPTEITEPHTSASQKMAGLYNGSGTDTTGNTFYFDKQVKVTPIDNLNNVLISPVNHTGFEPFTVKIYEIQLGEVHTVSTIADTNYIVVLDVLVDPYVLYFEGSNSTNFEMTFSGEKLP